MTDQNLAPGITQRGSMTVHKNTDPRPPLLDATPMGGGKTTGSQDEHVVKGYERAIEMYDMAEADGQFEPGADGRPRGLAHPTDGYSNSHTAAADPRSAADMKADLARMVRESDDNAGF